MHVSFEDLLVWLGLSDETLEFRKFHHQSLGPWHLCRGTAFRGGTAPLGGGAKVVSWKILPWEKPRNRGEKGTEPESGSWGSYSQERRQNLSRILVFAHLVCFLAPETKNLVLAAVERFVGKIFWQVVGLCTGLVSVYTATLKHSHLKKIQGSWTYMPYKDWTLNRY